MRLKIKTVSYSIVFNIFSSQLEAYNTAIVYIGRAFYNKE